MDTIKAAIEDSREREKVLPRLTVSKRGTVWNTIWADAGNGATTGIPGTISKLGAPQADALVATRTMEPRFREALAVAVDGLTHINEDGGEPELVAGRTLVRIAAILEGKP